MSGTRQKWDWSSHWPKMRELYEHQMSIPDIHKAIQCEGFKPCQRSVYLKFNDEGYPTDLVGRSRLLETGFPEDIHASNGTLFSTWTADQTPSFSDSQLEFGLGPLREDPMLMESINASAQNHHVDRSALEPLEYMDFQGPVQIREERSTECYNGFINAQVGGLHTWKSDSEPRAFPSWATSPSNANSPHFSQSASAFDQINLSQPSAMELNGAAYFGITADTYDALPVPNGTAHSRSLSGISDQSFGWESDIEIQEFTSFYGESFEAFQRNSSSSPTSTRNRLRSLFRPKSMSSSRSKKRYAFSQFTKETEDSGYASGFASCLSLDSTQIHPHSFKEFNSLYRVACHALHEPQRKAQCKDIPTCAYCRYSSIHNLGWSARYLKLEVFLSELKLSGVYDFGALDAAGNTALHYAAAGGASYQHLKALIDSGVDPYAANTAGELFIYCLRPLQPFTIEPNSDCLQSNDLINLLELLQPKRIFDWRDNNGQTVMHALSYKIIEPVLKAAIIKMFTDVGCSTTIPDRFGRIAEDIIPLTYDSHGQVIDPIPQGHNQHYNPTSGSATEHVNRMKSSDSILIDRRSQNIKQIRAQTIILEAGRSPTYRDPETGDNAVHALSTLDSKDIDHHLQNREGNYILQNLEYFISRGTDLNLHNRDGSHPLNAFICARPPEEGSETGATMSKYLDAILWKDVKNRVANNVNVNMRDRRGATALHCAATRGRPDSVRSLIEAGANVNARADNDLSALQATFHALDEAARNNDSVLVHLFKEVISHLEHAGAVLEPTSLQERGMRRP